MDFIKKFIYIYLFVLFFMRFRNLSTSSYQFIDSCYAFTSIFNIEFDHKDAFKNKDNIYTSVLIVKLLAAICGVIGLRIGPILLFFYIIFDSIFNVKNWNGYVLIFNMFIVTGLFIDIFTITWIFSINQSQGDAGEEDVDADAEGQRTSRKFDNEVLKKKLLLRDKLRTMKEKKEN